MTEIEVAYYKLNSDGNLTRIYRTVWTLYGSTTIHLISSDSQLRKRFLFSAKDKHIIKRYSNLSQFFRENSDKQIIIFETNGKRKLSTFTKEVIKHRRVILFFGGESVTIPVRTYSEFDRFKVETANRLCLINDVVTGITMYTILRRLEGYG
jgi:tRNA(Leu) C34 or U34 (ribose-2'-O)-methylase TrmL